MADQLTGKRQRRDVAQARHQEVCGLLEQIRDLLAMLACEQDEACEAEDDEDGPCLHPEEARINLSGFGEHGRHFICRTCGHEERPIQES